MRVGEVEFDTNGKIRKQKDLTIYSIFNKSEMNQTRDYKTNQQQ